jgi:hypothetical protein
MPGRVGTGQFGVARTLLLHKTGSPRIDYNMFYLFDFDSRRYSQLNLGLPADDEIAVSGDGGALFRTLGDFTDVVVDFMLWNEEPDWPGQSYQRHYQGSFTVDTGRLGLACVTGSPDDVMIDLPVPRGQFGLRAFRDSEETPDPEFPDMSHHDEQWLLQAWPLSS